MFDEILNVVLPVDLHSLLLIVPEQGDESTHVFNKHIITCYQYFLLRGLLVF